MVFNKKILKTNKGFTLLETIVAISILTIGLFGILTVLVRSGRSASLAQDKLIAASLVTEGLEIVYNLRDNNWLASRAWNFGLDGGNWQADSSSLALVLYNDTPLLFDQVTHLYTYTVSPNTITTMFKRKIILTAVSLNETKAVSEVTWVNRGLNYKVSAELHLYDWK